MSRDQELRVHLRSQQLIQDANGYTVWTMVVTPQTLPTTRTALVLCDVWDKHWCRGATERLAALLPRMHDLVTVLRERGVLIVHAPSDTMPFYAGSPARQRVLHAPVCEPPALHERDDPPLPVDTADHGCDTPPDRPHKPWSRQHAAIAIDQDRDAISDNGAELYQLYRQRSIEHLLVMGVHTNLCILHRSFAIKALVRWGFAPVLVRDLTDTMYNPARPPFVSHAESIRLVVEYIEKFWCPSVTSDELLAVR